MTFLDIAFCCKDTGNGSAKEGARSTTLLNEFPILHNYAQAFVVVVLRAAPLFDDVNTEKRRLWVLTNILALTQSRQSSLKIFASVVLDLSRQLPFIANTKGANAIPAICSETLQIKSNPSR